jgi:hypothetical protein
MRQIDGRISGVTWILEKHLPGAAIASNQASSCFEHLVRSERLLGVTFASMAGLTFERRLAGGWGLSRCSFRWVRSTNRWVSLHCRQLWRLSYLVLRLLRERRQSA